MPYKFQFGTEANNATRFTCTLRCDRCAGTTRTGEQCKRRVCIGLPLCWTHLQQQKHLRIKRSEIEHGGKGLFVSYPRRGNDIIFRPGNIIADYNGESIDEAELERRYGEFTAPYGIRQNRAIRDGACVRGVATMANTLPGKQNSNLIYAPRQHMFRLRATKNIHNNDEIYAAYGRSYRHREPTFHLTTYVR